MSGSNLHIAWARLFVRAAAQAGVSDVVLCPGGRSTPLAIAAAESPDVRCHPVVDERAAAFFALGQARVTGRPSLFVCTSGTAGAHALPAMIEACQAFVPLVVVTADRPWELAGAAAPQTIDQLKLFGDHARFFADLGLPDPSPGALRAVARIAAQAVARALGPVPGPVHVNARFRKPLEPADAPGPEPWQAEWEALMRRGGARVIGPRWGAAGAAPDGGAWLDEIAAACARAERGLVVCGPAPAAGDLARTRRAVAALAQKAGFPVLAEGTSQIRFGGLADGVVMPAAFDALLRAPEARARLAPDLILELGAPPTSAGYAALVAERPACPRYVIAPHGWSDPASLATALVHADPGEVCEALAARLAPARGPSPWSEVIARAGARADAIAAAACAEAPLSEGAVIRAAVAACPDEAWLAIGNSMPVRDLDTYCPPAARPLRVLHQRGASGIDGLVSAAAGAWSAAGAPVTLVLGDLSLLHDLNGLGLAARARGGPALVVVVVQNDGGRIFEHLPVARRPGAEDLVERCFTMPQHLDLAPAAALFGLAYARAGTGAALSAALDEAHRRGGATLIEAVVPPRDGAARAARLLEDVRRSLEPAPQISAPRERMLGA